MIYIYVDKDRKYLEVTASLVAKKTPFQLLKTESPDPKKGASAFWCADPKISKQWLDAGIAKHDLDLPEPTKRRDSESAGAEK